MMRTVAIAAAMVCLSSVASAQNMDQMMALMIGGQASAKVVTVSNALVAFDPNLPDYGAILAAIEASNVAESVKETARIVADDIDRDAIDMASALGACVGDLATARVRLAEGHVFYNNEFFVLARRKYELSLSASTTAGNYLSQSAAFKSMAMEKIFYLTDLATQ